MNLGEIPSSLKAAQIRPMLKKINLDWSMLANYRPMSTLCFLSKTKDSIASQRYVTPRDNLWRHNH